MNLENNTVVIDSVGKIYSKYIDGFMDYNDLTTQSTPIVYTTPNITKITCDGAGVYTVKTFKPYNVTELFDTVNNRFKFDELAIGDEVLIRCDILVTTSSNNQNFELNLQLDTTGTPYYINFGQWHIKTAGEQKIVAERHIYIGNTGTKNNPAEMHFNSDANATIKVNGFYISTKRRFY